MGRKEQICYPQLGSTLSSSLVSFLKEQWAGFGITRSYPTSSSFLRQKLSCNQSWSLSSGKYQCGSIWFFDGACRVGDGRQVQARNFALQSLGGPCGWQPLICAVLGKTSLTLLWFGLLHSIIAQLWFREGLHQMKIMDGAWLKLAANFWSWTTPCRIAETEAYANGGPVTILTISAKENQNLSSFGGLLD